MVQLYSYFVPGVPNEGLSSYLISRERSTSETAQRAASRRATLLGCARIGARLQKLAQAAARVTLRRHVQRARTRVALLVRVRTGG